MLNPFQFGRELDGTELVDRTEDVEAVARTIAEAGKLFIIGPRRYGKTSILKAGTELAEKSRGCVVLRFDVEAYPTLDLLVGAILIEATKKLVGRIDQAGEKIKKFFARLRPEVSFSMTDQTWSASLGAANVQGAEAGESQVVLLTDVFNGVERLAGESGKPVGIILDEFQKVIELGGREAEGQIRATVQRHRKVGYVFAGSKTRMLTDMTGDAARPFYRLGSRRFIGPVPRDEFRAFLIAKFSQSNFKIREHEARLILELAEEVPYNVQMLAHECWEALRSGKGKQLTEEVIRRVREQIVRQDDPFYTQLWNSLTATQQKALTAVVRQRGGNLLSNQVTRSLQMPTSTMQRAVGALLARDIIREEEAGGEVRYRLEDPFLGAWVDLIAAKPVGVR